jgi:hypothetical protein
MKFGIKGLSPAFILKACKPAISLSSGVAGFSKYA